MKLHNPNFSPKYKRTEYHPSFIQPFFQSLYFRAKVCDSPPIYIQKYITVYVLPRTEWRTGRSVCYLLSLFITTLTPNSPPHSNSINSPTSQSSSTRSRHFRRRDCRRSISHLSAFIMIQVGVAMLR